MKGLLIKDIKLMKNMLRLVGAILVFSIVFSTTGENIFFSMGYISVFVAILSITSINYDEYDNGMAYLFSLPFSRKEYVQEKYLFGLGMILAGITISGLISLSVSLIMKVAVSKEEWLAVIVSSVSVAIIMIALVLPTQIKYGSDKGRLAMIVVFLSIALLGAAVYGLGQLLGIDIESKLDELFYSPVKMMLTIGLVSIVALAGSYMISLKIILKKEF